MPELFPLPEKVPRLSVALISMRYVCVFWERLIFAAHHSDLFAGVQHAEVPGVLFHPGDDKLFGAIALLSRSCGECGGNDFFSIHVSSFRSPAEGKDCFQPCRQKRLPFLIREKDAAPF